MTCFNHVNHVYPLGFFHPELNHTNCSTKGKMSLICSSLVGLENKWSISSALNLGHVNKGYPISFSDYYNELYCSCITYWTHDCGLPVEHWNTNTENKGFKFDETTQKWPAFLVCQTICHFVLVKHSFTPNQRTPALDDLIDWCFTLCSRRFHLY